MTQSSQTVHEHVTQPFSLLTVVRVYDVRGSEEDIKVIHFNHTSRYRFCGVFNKEPFLHDEPIQLYIYISISYHIVESIRIRSYTYIIRIV